MKDLKTSIVGLVLIGVGCFLIVESRKASPDAIAILTTGAGFLAAADSKKNA